MPASPGAIAPGSTPDAASGSVLKALFTVQGLALVGAGAWLMMKRRKGKATRSNPSAAWGRSMRKRRGAWLKRRFNKNPKADAAYETAYAQGCDARDTGMTLSKAQEVAQTFGYRKHAFMNGWKDAGTATADTSPKKNPATAADVRRLTLLQNELAVAQGARKHANLSSSPAQRKKAQADEVRARKLYRHFWRLAEKTNPTDPRIRWVKIHDPKHKGWVAEIHQPGHTIQRFWGKDKSEALRKIEAAALKTNPSPKLTEKVLHQLWTKHYAHTSPVRHKQSAKADRVASRLLSKMPAGRTRNYVTRRFEERGFHGQSPEILPVPQTLSPDWLPERPALRAYNDGSRWNGWAEPMVTETQLRKIAKVFNKDLDSIKGYGGTSFEKRKDGWYVVQYEEGGKVDSENTYKLSFHPFRTAKGVKKLANIGCGLTWEWKERG